MSSCGLLSPEDPVSMASMTIHAAWWKRLARAAVAVALGGWPVKAAVIRLDSPPRTDFAGEPLPAATFDFPDVASDLWRTPEVPPVLLSFPVERERHDGDWGFLLPTDRFVLFRLEGLVVSPWRVVAVPKTKALSKRSAPEVTRIGWTSISEYRPHPVSIDRPFQLRLEPAPRMSQGRFLGASSAPGIPGVDSSHDDPTPSAP